MDFVVASAEHVYVLSLHLCLTLCDPTDCRLQAPLLSPALAGGFITTSAAWASPALGDSAVTAPGGRKAVVHT